MEQREDLQPDPVKNGPPSTEESSVSHEEEPLTFRQWLAHNGPTLFIVLALFGYLFVKFDGDGLWAIAKAFFGLSFVIFIHELGHFLVAKWCDVHVTTFSIGFGPAIPGCSYTRGETTYKLALFPLGGYVQMVGQVDGDEGADGSETDPRSYRNKSVGQRMAIISAGVIMNVILAVICFILVYQGPGKDRQAAVIAAVDTGAPAFRDGLRSGTEILEIADVKYPFFEDLMITVMTTVQGQKLNLVTRSSQGKEPITQEIEPRKGKDDLRPVIGILPSDRTELASKLYVDSGLKWPAYPGSPAAKAEPPFEFGDRIVAMTDPDNPKEVTELPADPRLEDFYQRRGETPPAGRVGLKDYFELNRRMQMLAGQAVIARVERKTSGGAKTLVDIKLPPAHQRTLGVRMHIGQITAIRKESPAAAAGVRAFNAATQLKGDIVRAVKVLEADGSVTQFEGKSLDPVRLPFQLRQWADRLDGNGAKEPRKVTLQVRRDKKDPGGPAFEDLEIVLDWDDAWRFDRVVPLGPASPLAIPELGLAYQVKNVVAEIEPDATTSLLPGDEITRVRFTFVGPKDEEEASSWIDLDQDDQWAFIDWNFLQAPLSVKKIAFKVKRDKEVKEVEVTPTFDESWPKTNRGLIFMKDVRRQRADGVFAAIALGFNDTHKSMIQVFQSLRGIILGRLSVKNLGGPVMIAQAAYRIAGVDFWEFIFFLGLISINLAVINFLPIPVLDGGHMVFLIYEKIRGKPASEAIRVGATYAGLALILCLMVFVIYMDISRLLL